MAKKAKDVVFGILAVDVKNFATRLLRGNHRSPFCLGSGYAQLTS